MCCFPPHFVILACFPGFKVCSLGSGFWGTTAVACQCKDPFPQPSRGMILSSRLCALSVPGSWVASSRDGDSPIDDQCCLWFHRNTPHPTDLGLSAGPIPECLQRHVAILRRGLCLALFAISYRSPICSPVLLVRGTTMWSFLSSVCLMFCCFVRHCCCHSAHLRLGYSAPPNGVAFPVCIMPTGRTRCCDSCAVA